MRYAHESRIARAAVASALVVALSATFTFSLPSSAHAAPRAKSITRVQVLKRARAWVSHRVPYSQSRYHRGYRQDCSGFVSMAWALGTSYTTRSLPSVSRRIPSWRLRPGDAVIGPGHAVIFGGWKNRRAKTYYAYEEPTWGKVAQKRVRSFKSNSKAYRRPGIRDHVRIAKKRPARRHAPRVAIAVKSGEKPTLSSQVLSSTSAALTAPAISHTATVAP